MQAEKLSISVPADMAAMIRRRVESGAYASNSEVIRDALRLWMEREMTKEQRLEGSAGAWTPLWTIPAICRPKTFGVCCTTPTNWP
jgi:putative addiction module CopG family antidote